MIISISCSFSYRLWTYNCSSLCFLIFEISASFSLRFTFFKISISACILFIDFRYWSSLDCLSSFSQKRLSFSFSKPESCKTWSLSCWITRFRLMRDSLRSKLTCSYFSLSSWILFLDLRMSSFLRFNSYICLWRNSISCSWSFWFFRILEVSSSTSLALFY